MLDRSEYPNLNLLQNEVTDLARDRQLEPNIKAIGYLANLMNTLVGQAQEFFSFNGVAKVDVQNAGRLLLLSELLNKPMTTSKHLTRNEAYVLTQFFTRANEEDALRGEVYLWLFAHENEIKAGALARQALRLKKAS